MHLRKMKKQYPIQIWFLAEEPMTSAQMLSNKLLVKNIKGCIQSLVCSYFYYIGIRSIKFYKYFFSKEKKQETMDKFFFSWPLSKQPSFQQYGTRISKWCRKCKEHFEYVKSCLQACCSEYEYRFNKQCKECNFVEWLENDAVQIKIPTANLKSVTLEWKSLDPKYRRKDIVEGYKLQYKAKLLNYPLSPSDFTNRDIPEFLLAKQQDKWLD